MDRNHFFLQRQQQRQQQSQQHHQQQQLLRLQQQQQQQQQQNPNPNLYLGEIVQNLPQLQKRQFPSVYQPELQLAYQDALRVCYPDFKRPFSSLEDAHERLLPYHVIADYEEEEDDKILDSDTTGQLLSCSQQWDHNIAAKIADFLTAFEKQAENFNVIVKKRADGESRSEERLVIEHAVLQEQKRCMLRWRTEMEASEKATHDTQLRAETMVQVEQATAHSQAETNMMAQFGANISALGSQGISFGQQMRNHEHSTKNS